MSKPVIIIAPQGAGKTLHAQQLVKALGCTRLVEEWDGLQPLKAGDLALTNREIGCPMPEWQVMTLADALQQVTAVA